jgi:epoxyqueuosine reductase QueG
MQVEVRSREALAERNGGDESIPPLPAPKRFLLFNPTLEGLASITEEDFQRVFARSPINRARYRGWLRNLCVVMGNSGDRRFIPWLEAAAHHPDHMVQEHAAWALRSLQGGV